MVHPATVVRMVMSIEMTVDEAIAICVCVCVCVCVCGLVSLLNGISTFVGYLTIPVEEQQWIYSTSSWGKNKGFYTFTEGISSTNVTIHTLR